MSPRDVKNGSPLSQDFKPGQLPAGPRGPQGPPGARGPEGPSGPTYRALVSSTGTLVAGSALSASRSNEGVYIVRFPRSVAGCSGAANSASFPGSETVIYRVWVSIDLQNADPRDVEVQVFNDDEANDDSAFSLVLACP